MSEPTNPYEAPRTRPAARPAPSLKHFVSAATLFALAPLAAFIAFGFGCGASFLVTDTFGSQWELGPLITVTVGLSCALPIVVFTGLVTWGYSVRRSELAERLSQANAQKNTPE
jgi:hypothetical protein